MHVFVTSMLEMDFGETQPVYRVGAGDRYSQGEARAYDSCAQITIFSSSL